MKTNLEILVSFFGWQGGTLAQVTNEVNFRLGEKFFVESDILNMSPTTLKVLMEFLKEN